MTTDKRAISPPWLPGTEVPKEAFRSIQRAMAIEDGRTDPQIGDTAALSPIPLILRPGAWADLTGLAESLYAESLQIESALLADRHMRRRLPMPAAIHRACDGMQPPSLARVMRFDFHWTTAGWQVSEVNADVPGGFLESSGFSRRMAAAAEGCETLPDPARTLASAIARRLGCGGTVALVYATSYADDAHQMAWVGRALAAVDVKTRHMAPDSDAVDACEGVVRFFPAEWLTDLPRRTKPERWFSILAPPASNPASALLLQNKAWGAFLNDLPPCPTWKQLLPETRSIGWFDPMNTQEWVIKPALGRVGEGIGMRHVSTPAEWAELRAALRWGGRRHHLRQRRFNAIPWPTTRGPLYPCLGVWVIEGKAAGIYGRAGAKPLVDGEAYDLAVLRSNVAPPSLSTTPFPATP